MVENRRRLINPYLRNCPTFHSGDFDDVGLKSQSRGRDHYGFQDWKAYYELGLDSVCLRIAGCRYGSISEPLIYLTHRSNEFADERDRTLYYCLHDQRLSGSLQRSQVACRLPSLPNYVTGNRAPKKVE